MNFFSFLNKHSEKCVILILIIYSFFINHYYGFQGFNYVDSFQHITGGKKILEGSLPFKDYWIQAIGNALPDYNPDDQPFPLNDPISKGWFYKQFDAESITYEIGDETPRDFIKLKAETAAREMMKLLILK